MKTLLVLSLLLTSSLAHSQVELRPEPRKPILDSGENFIYKEVGRIPLEDHKLGSEIFDLSQLGQAVTLTTTQAPMRQVIERSVGPICVSIVVTNPNTGKPIGDPDKCKSVEFDKFIPSETFSKNINISKSLKQDPSVPFEGSVQVTLGADKRLSYKLSGVSSSLFVLGTELRDGSIALQTAQPTEEVKNVAKVVKSISVSKGILSIETNTQKVEGYRFSYKVILNPKLGTNKEIAFLGIRLGEKYTKVESRNGVSVINVDIKNQLADAGKSYETKKRYNFEVLASAEKLIKGETEQSILQSSAEFNTNPTISTAISKVIAD